jgi:hypothetical protein
MDAAEVVAAGRCEAPMIWIWIYYGLLIWLGGGAIMFVAALLVDALRGEDVGVAYVTLHAKAALFLVLVWPWALVLVLFECWRSERP